MNEHQDETTTETETTERHMVEETETRTVETPVDNESDAE